MPFPVPFPYTYFPISVAHYLKKHQVHTDKIPDLTSKQMK